MRFPKTKVLWTGAPLSVHAIVQRCIDDIKGLKRLIWDHNFQSKLRYPSAEKYGTDLSAMPERR